jgi:uncharacterized protein YjbI with pentapeptide repeats
MKMRLINRIFIGVNRVKNMILNSLKRSPTQEIFLVSVYLLLILISGFLVGIITSLVLTNILFPESGSSVFTGLCIVLVNTSWLGSILMDGSFLKSLKIPISITLIALVAMTIYGMLGLVDALSGMAILLFSCFTLATIIICFMLVCFCFLVANNHKSRFKKWIKFILYMFFASSLLIGIHTYASGYDKSIIARSLIPALQTTTMNYIQFCSGTFFGGSVLTSASLLSRTKSKQISFLQPWAIALCAFGNTSFHNKDLSYTDFSNADLANIDLRAKSFYQTCFRGATGLDRARLDDRYFDITSPKVQQLLTQGTTTDPDLSTLNLQGAYLKAAELPSCTLIDTNITRADLSGGNLRNTNLLRANISGADLTGADLRGSILVQSDLTGTDLTGSNLTGACIENWNINGRTIFIDVQCDYIYRKLDDTGKPTDRYPRDRDFEPGEFVSLYQEVENAVELIFKEGINWRAFAFSLQKLQIEDEGLGLQLRGIEKRGDLWVVKVTHDQNVSNAVVESKLGAAYETLQRTLAAKEQEVNQLLGIMTVHAGVMSKQAEALNELSKKPFGNQFNITGSTITNLAGSGQIEYTEAADQVRNLVANNTNNAEVSQIAQRLLSQLQHRLASTESEKAELIYQIILTEAGRDPLFKQFILQQSVSLLAAIPQGPIATAFQAALETLRPQT